MYFHNSLIPRGAYFLLPLESKQEATSGWNFTKCISEVKVNQLKVKNMHVRMGISTFKAKKNCYIGVTRPTLKLGPTLHLKKTKQNKTKKTKKQPTGPKKSKTCDFFFFFNTARRCSSKKWKLIQTGSTKQRIWRSQATPCHLSENMV